jgi:hypothetical protein
VNKNDPAVEVEALTVEPLGKRSLQGARGDGRLVAIATLGEALGQVSVGICSAAGGTVKRRYRVPDKASVSRMSITPS